MDDSQNVPLLAPDASDISMTTRDAKLLAEPAPIGVLGTGNFAKAITDRLVSSGYRVVIGSRKPAIRQAYLSQVGDCLCGSDLTTIENCLRRCHIIIVAIHMENFKVTLQQYSNLTKGKILVDVSNREMRYVSRSNAEYLSSILPHAEVVKAFNSVSAVEMENDMGMSLGGQKVFVAGDSKAARNTVLDLSKSMGFQAVDFGRLKNSLYLEDFVLKVFPNWKIPIFLTFGIFNLWSLYIVYIYFIDKTAYKWEQVFLKVFNKPLCMTAFTVLALTYLPGQIAAILQVYRGTKHSRFPKFLDTWLKSRRQFGLISFSLVAFHVIASTLMMSPTYYSSWYHQPTVVIPGNSSTLTDTVLPVSTTWMIWKGELALFFGIVSFLVMSLQAITSVQAVANVLNWSEWNCIHSHMGTGLLFFVSCHVIAMGAPGWYKVGPIKTLGSITFLSLILPITVLILKIMFRFTPLNGYLRKIRQGWERNSDKGSFELNHGANIKPTSCCKGERSNFKMNKRKDLNGCGCSGPLDSSAVIEEKSCCIDVPDSDSIEAKQCHCASPKGQRDKTSVRFATNTRCDCSVV